MFGYVKSPVDGEEFGVYDINDFPYEAFEWVQRVESKSKKYFDIIATFDIETTSVPKEEKMFFDYNWGFMYVWQFCIDGVVVMGRTWDEYATFLCELRNHMWQSDSKLVVYVHNLQFEFQFMRNFFDFQDIFARKRRQIIDCRADWVEYRCSYMLSNMSLDMFLKKTKGVTWYKQQDKFDYGKMRFPDTPLDEDEMLYCVCDVMGLWQAINGVFEVNDCNVLTVPRTSTGFVRQDYREKCRNDKEHMNRFYRGRLNQHQYNLLKKTSRGGIAGSNALNSDYVITDCDSFDIKSSYPYQMATKYFPEGRFIFENVDYGTDAFYNYLCSYCCDFIFECHHLRLKTWENIPYISKAKCIYLEKGMYGNGKVYGAEMCVMALTEIDFRIICDHYTFREPKVHQFMMADKGMLSKAFREHLMEMFQKKTDLEDGDPYDYMKYKNRINASFGMMLTDILRPEVIYQPWKEKVWDEKKIKDFDDGLRKYYNSHNSFLSYQDGVWVLAHARADLVCGMDIVGTDIVQVDTDSVKTTGNYRAEFNALNESIIECAESYDVKPYSVKNGKKVYLGIWEHEHSDGGSGDQSTYKAFKTLGAKKYCYIDYKDILHTTVAGLGKKKGAQWLMENGGIDMFRNGTTIDKEHSGRLTAYYNDLPGTITLLCRGHFITVGSNIALLDSEYTLGVTEEWEALIAGEREGELPVDDENCGVGGEDLDEVL